MTSFLGLERELLRALTAFAEDSGLVPAPMLGCLQLPVILVLVGSDAFTLHEYLYPYICAYTQVA